MYKVHKISYLSFHSRGTVIPFWSVIFIPHLSYADSTSVRSGRKSNSGVAGPCRPWRLPMCSFVQNMFVHLRCYAYSSIGPRYQTFLCLERLHSQTEIVD
ncbi:hypothetical protein EDD22DRAFT_303547 [Suillus occidentalis]|nr:hypothetical protein EDD22DRAFT_303547 [Suillus occidentalis]